MLIGLEGFNLRGTNVSSFHNVFLKQACRRQPPAWFLSLLLSEYPECASAVTQFGQLPLHLAVESGATPEVVNLLVVAYWDGIVACDQSGRTPMEILNSNELLALEDHRVVFESLQRCHTAYTNFQKRTEATIVALKNKHKATFLGVKRKHEEEIKREQEKQQEIRNEVKSLEARIFFINDGVKARDAQLATFTTEEQRWMDRVKELAHQVSHLKEQLQDEKDNVQALVNTVQNKDKVIASRDAKIEVLCNDLRKIVVLHERDVADGLIEAERSMRSMVGAQIALQNQLLGQTKAMKNLLVQRGISMTPGTGHHKPHKQEEKANAPEEVDGEAATAAVAAAVAALHIPPKTSA